MEVGVAHERPQDAATATFAPKIDRESARVDWTRPAVEVARGIRAYDPKPGAFAVHRGQDIKLFGAQATSTIDQREPGLVMLVDGQGMSVACGDGAVQITSVQPSGKRRLLPAELANGRGIAVGERLS